VPGLRICALPAFIGLAILFSLGAGLWVSALSVKYKDFRYIIPFTVQLGLYLSPVGFSSAVVPERWRLAYAFNPMVGVIEGFRWSVLGIDVAGLEQSVGLSAAISLLLLLTGFTYFRRLERSIAELL
jgi:lipopolysaccharide transport system permease protein